MGSPWVLYCGLGVNTPDFEVFNFDDWRPCKALYQGDASAMTHTTPAGTGPTDFFGSGRCCVTPILDPVESPHMFCLHGTLEAFRPITSLTSAHLHNVYTSGTAADDLYTYQAVGNDLRDTVPVTSANIHAYSTVAPSGWPQVSGLARVEVTLPSDLPDSASLSDFWSGLGGLGGTVSGTQLNQPILDLITSERLAVWLRAGRRGHTRLFDTASTVGATKSLNTILLDYFRMEGEALLEVELAATNPFLPAQAPALSETTQLLTIRGTFGRGPSYLCRWVFVPGDGSSGGSSGGGASGPSEITYTPASLGTSGSTDVLTCAIPSNQGRVGLVNVSLVVRSGNSGSVIASVCSTSCLGDSGEVDPSCTTCREYLGATLPPPSADPHVLGYTVSCATSCNEPSAPCPAGEVCNQCNERLGVCECAANYIGASCESCGEVVAENQCGTCLQGFNSCGWCAKTLRCGRCDTPADTALFRLTGDASVCPALDSTATVDVNGQNFVYVTGGPFYEELGTEYACAFGTYSTQEAEYLNKTTVRCAEPEYRELEPLNVTLRILYNRTLYLPTTAVYTLSYTPPVEQVDPLPIALGSAAAIVGVALMIGGVFGYVQHRRKLAADRFRSLFLPPEFKLDSAFTEYYYLSFTERSDIERKSGEFWYLEELLFDEDYYFLDAMTDTFETHESDDISRAIMYVAEGTGKATAVLDHFIRRQVQASEDGANIFRGYNPASKIWTGYSRIQAGQSYAYKTLHMVLYRACTSYAEHGLEVDPERLRDDATSEEKAAVTENSFILLTVAQRIFNAIVESIDFIPPQFSLIATSVFQAVEDRFPGEGQRSVASFFFLRFWAPAISAPEAFGDGLLKVTPSESARRLLILTAKVLINLANHVLFTAKNEALQNLNDFIETNVTVLSQWCDEISSADPDELAGSFDTEAIPADIRLVSLALIHQYVIDHLERITDQLESLIPKDRVERFEAIRSALTTTIERLGDPIALIPPASSDESDDDYY